MRLGHRARGIKPPDVVGRLGDLDALGVGALGDFVADAPEDHAGMVAVAQDHGVQIALPPVLEEPVVVVGVLALLPAVEGFVHDQHAQPVAGVEEGRRGRIVAGADGIEAAGLQQLDAALLGAVNGRRAQRPVVVVHAAALAQLSGWPLSGKPRSALNWMSRMPKGRPGAVHHRAARQHLHFSPVKRWLVRRPQRGRRDLQRERSPLHLPLAREREPRGIHRFATRPQQARAQRDRRLVG